MTIKISPPGRGHGFTLLELLMVIAIIGILAALAFPTYKKYINEAKAADLLVHIHEISLAYHDVFATAPGSASHDDLSSPGFGQPPAFLPGLQRAYTRTHDVSFSSQLVNHSGFFQHTGHGEFPVLFLRAESPGGEAILRALDHITGLEHTFVTPSVMMFALARPHEVHTAGPVQTGTTTDTSGPDTTTTDTTTGQSSQTGTTDQPAAQSTGGGSTVAPVTNNQLNWPPGWVKHPQQHINQQHGHNG